MFKINEFKTKWQPIFVYTPVAINGMNIVYARYNKKTGLYDFKTQRMWRGNYSCDKVKLHYETEEILNKLREE